MIKTWKQSNDPDFEAKKNRVLELYDIADGKAKPKQGRSDRRDLHGRVRAAQPAAPPGKQWAPMIVKGESSTAGPRRRRRRATYTRTKGVRHLMAAYDLDQDKIYGHIKTKKDRTTFLEFCRYLRSLYPPNVRIAIVMDNFSPHLSTKKDDRVGATGPRPTTSSWPTSPPTPAG